MSACLNKDQKNINCHIFIEVAHVLHILGLGMLKKQKLGSCNGMLNRKSLWFPFQQVLGAMILL